MLQTKQILANPNYIQASGSTLTLSGTTEIITINGKPNISVTANNITLQTLSSGSTNNMILDASLLFGAGFNNTILCVTTQPDGKILVGGNFTHSTNTYTPGIARLNADGTPDTSFLPYITSTGFGGGVQAMALQPDGKIVAIGSFTSYSGVTANGIIRLHPNGKVDATFVSGTGFDINSGALLEDVKIQSDGKIIVIGYFDTYSGVTRHGIIRLHPNGKVDATFVSGAGFDTGAFEIAAILALQSDGKLVLGGFFNSYSGVTKHSLLRLNTDGSIDNTFLDGNPSDYIAGLAIQTNTDNKIIVTGAFHTYSGVTKNGIVRLNTNGSIDNTFTTGTGLNIDGFTEFGGQTLKLQIDNKILIGGSSSSYNGVSKGTIFRLNSDGTLDSTFVTGAGTVSGSVINGIGVQLNGNVIFGGTHQSYNNTSQRYLTQVSTTGSIINIFPFYNAGFNVLNISIARIFNGKYLIGGSFSQLYGVTANGIVSLNTDGTVDNTTFLTGVGFSTSTQPVTSAVQSDGKIIFGGTFTSYSGVTSNRIIRLHPNGKVDATFVIGTGFNTGTVNAISIQSDGKIIAGGSFTSYSGVTSNRIIRLHPNGKVDATFVIGTGFVSTVSAIDIQLDGKIYVGGSSNTYSGVTSRKLIRLNSNGSIDTSFGTRFNAFASVASLVIQSDGKLLVGGNFTTYSGITTQFLMRLNIDTTKDSTFLSTTLDSTVSKISIRSDGYLYIAGGFSTYNGTPVSKIMRLTSNGILDPTLTIANIDSGVNAIGFGSDNTVLIIGGTFTKVDNNTRTGFARLASTPVHVYVSSIAGIEYLGDYSAGYTSRSLTDKSYTDTKVSSVIPTAVNGLTKSGNNIRLGGTLTGNTRIALGSNTLSFSGSSASIGFSATGNSSISIASSANLDMGGSTGSLLKFSQNFGKAMPYSNGGKLIVGSIVKSVIQSDEKLIIAGVIKSYAGVSLTKSDIIRFNTDGTLDNTFNYAGSYLSNTLPINSMALQADGKLVVTAELNFANANLRIARFNTDGSYDTSFIIGGTNGFTDGAANSIAIQADQKIVVCGDFNTYSGVTANHIIRLHPNGKVDATFVSGTGFGTGFTFVPCIVVVQPSDQKIIVGGNFTTYSGVSRTGIIRLHPNGKVDATFLGGSGFLNSGSNAIKSIKFQTDNKILVGGSFISYSGVTANRIIRLHPNGKIDATFTGTGFTGAGNNSVGTISIQSDGKIYVGGSFSSYNGIANNNHIRLNSDGTIDNTFVVGSGVGLGLFQSDPKIKTSQIFSGGTIFLGGDYTGVNGVNRINAAVLTNVGTPNNIFSANNLGFNGVVQSSVLLSDGNLIAVGFFTTYSGKTANRIVKLTNEGLVDGTFNIGGSGFFPTSSSIFDVKSQSDGKIIITGNINAYNNVSLSNKGVIRLNENGVLDSTFTGGTVVGTVYSAGIQSNGKIVVSGSFSSYSGVSRNNIIRLHPNGKVDATFVIGSGFTGGYVQKIIIQPDDKILACGTFATYSGVTKNSIIRLNSNGSIDSTFNSGASGFTAGAVVYTMFLQSDGKILIGGSSFDNNGVTYNGVQSTGNFMRLNSNGTWDTTTSFQRFNGFNSLVNVISVQSNGKILVGGSFDSFKSITNRGIVRLNADWTLDTSSGLGIGTNDYNGTATYVYTITPFSVNSNYFIGGQFGIVGSASLISGGIINNNYGAVLQNPVGFEYGSDYSASFNDLSLVHKGYVSNQVLTEKNSVLLSLLTTTPFTATTSNDYIHCSGTSAITIYLPSIPKTNQQIIVSDVKGNATAQNITINGNGKKINGATTALINSNYGSVILVYNGINWHGSV